MVQGVTQDRMNVRRRRNFPFLRQRIFVRSIGGVSPIRGLLLLSRVDFRFITVINFFRGVIKEDQNAQKRRTARPGYGYKGR